MIIIFLDIDGVVNHELWFRSQYGKEDNFPLSHISPDSVELLNTLVRGLDYNCRFVISSTWRKNRSSEEMQTLLNGRGFIGEVIDSTPTSYYTIEEERREVPRGVEIDYWLNHTKEKVENYIILDDDSDMLLHQRNHFFLVDSYCGITSNVVYKVLRYLKGEL